MFEFKVWGLSLKLRFLFEVQVWSSSLQLKSEVEVWSLILKLEVEVDFQQMYCDSLYEHKETDLVVLE